MWGAQCLLEVRRRFLVRSLTHKVPLVSVMLTEGVCVLPRVGELFFLVDAASHGESTAQHPSNRARRSPAICALTARRSVFLCTKGLRVERRRLRNTRLRRCAHPTSPVTCTQRDPSRQAHTEPTLSADTQTDEVRVAEISPVSDVSRDFSPARQ